LGFASSIVLTPCPFCGTSISGLGEAITGGGWFIQCECGAEMSADTQVNAIDQWNRRFVFRTAREANRAVFSWWFRKRLNMRA